MTMSKVIEVLAEMGSNALLKNKKELVNMIFFSTLSEKQQQAILAKDINTLTTSIYNFPQVKCFPIVLFKEKELDHASMNQNRANF